MVNSIEYSPYVLEPRLGFKNLPCLEGAFLRIDGGYSDLVVWPHLKQGTVLENLDILKKTQTQDKLPWHLQIALFLAQSEAQARKEKRNLLRELSHGIKALAEPIQSYAFSGMIDEALGLVRECSYPLLKVKAKGLFQAKALKTLLDALNKKPQKLIVDWNGSLTESELFSLGQDLTSDQKSRIAYFEDPTVLKSENDLDRWSRFSEKYGISLAADQVEDSLKNRLENRIDQGPPEFLYTVVKPWVEPLDPILESAALSMRRIVITNQMGHGFHSLLTLHLVATHLATHSLLFEPMGLMSQSCWDDPWGLSTLLKFSARGNIEVNENWAKVGSYGWGLDSVFEKLQWQKV